MLTEIRRNLKSTPSSATFEAQDLVQDNVPSRDYITENLKSLNSDTLHKLIKMYQHDFLLFDYDPLKYL